MSQFVRKKNTMSRAMCATGTQTSVRYLRILNTMSGKLDKIPGPAALNLRQLRLKARIGFREMARLCDMPFTQYRHYEDKLKSKYLPPDIYDIVKPVLVAHGISIDELRVLIHEVFRKELTQQLEGVHQHLAEIERLMRGKAPSKD